MYIPQHFRLSLPTYIIIIGTFFSRFGTSVIFPYLTLYLASKKGLPLYWPGIAIGLSYFAHALSGFSAGYLASRYGYLKVLRLSIIFYAATFFLMGYAGHALTNKVLIGIIFIICCTLGGVVRSFIETIGQIIISDTTPLGQKHFAFSLRYTLMNVGSTLGPILAVILGIVITSASYFLAAILVIFYAFLLQKIAKSSHFTEMKQTTPPPFFQSLYAIFRDKQCLYFVIAGIIGFIANSQMEALFAYVSFQNTGSNRVFVEMFAINTITVVLVQILLTEYTKRFDIHYVILSGLLFYTISLIGIALAGKVHFYYYLSMFIFTLGEILALSLVGIYIDTKMGRFSKEMCFGITSFVFIGNVIGSPLGTWLCYQWGIKGGLFAMVAITLLGIPFILAAKREATLINVAS
ncbi:MFS transporter [soil metagenome]